MTSQQWLQNTGRRFLRLMQEEDIIFLSQIEVSPEEETELLKQIGQ